MRRLPLALNSFAAALCIIIGTQRADAQTLVSTSDVPRTLSYQGLLTSTDGTPVHDGEYRITLALYADPAGTIKVWEDTYATPIIDGIFNVYLGSGNMLLPDPGTMNRPLWVGTRIDDTDEMRPLTPLSASPYALNVPDRTITTGKLADGAVTAEKVDMDYIAGIAVNGQPVAAKGSLLNIEGSGDIALTYNDETNTIRLSKPTPATRGDGEKGSEVMANQDQVWSANGDGWDAGLGTPYTPVSGDWIGTSGNVTFEMKTYGQTAMRYQPSGTSTPNVLGGSGNNTISSASVGSVIAGGGSAGIINQITNNATYAVIGGGSYHTVSADHATVGGGRQNQVSADYATAAGGAYHIVSGEYAIAGGGAGNTASGSHAAVLGGESNTASGLWTVVGGGSWNAASGPHAAIAGGSDNTASADHATIGGGYDNATEGTYSFIGGGEYNRIQYDADHSAIVGGQDNLIEPESQWAFIGGGDGNHIEGSYVVIGGGENNTASGFHTTIGGGQQNTVVGHDATIAGGSNNNIASNATYGSIGGGQNNNVYNGMGAIGGGSGNSTGTLASGGYGATVGGGQDNSAIGDYAAIGGGYDNNADANYVTVAGGRNNVVSGIYSTIGGGYNNSITGSYAVISGGDEHLASAINTTIAGGWDHTASGSFATVGGGRRNVASGNLSVIPGGDNLQTNSYAQTAVGFYNAPRTTGNISARPTAAANALNNNPIFMVGNGGSGATATQANAFEVSYNGHTTVYGTNNITNVVATPTIYGATYTDNILYAWGDIGIGGGGAPIPNGVFGVQNIARLGAGIYQITITVVDPVTSAPVFLDDASIVATLVAENPEQFPCGTIAVTRLDGQNRFKVCTKNAACQAVDLPFMFHLTGRNR